MSVLAPTKTVDAIFNDLHERVMARFDVALAAHGPGWFEHTGDLLEVAKEVRAAWIEAEFAERIG